MVFSYEYPRPTVTVDAVVLRSPKLEKIQILLIKRGNEPFKGKWALPGGFLEMDENPQRGAERELEEETCVCGLPLKPIFTCGQLGRDPRARCITMVYGCLVRDVAQTPKGSDDAAEAEWFSIFALPEMSFDHARIIKQVVQSLKWQAKTSIIGQDIFNESCSIEELQKLTNLVLDVDQDVNQDILDNSTDELLARALELDLIKEIGQGRYKFNKLSNEGPDWVSSVW